MPRNDYEAVNREVAGKPDNKRATSKTKSWMQSPENLERMLDAIAAGRSLRRFCEDEGLTYSVAQAALVRDHEPAYRAAQEREAEHLLGEQLRIMEKLEAGDIDAKAASVILDTLRWRITKFNQRRFGDRQVIEQHTFDHTRMHVEALRQLARAPRAGILTGQGTPRLGLQAAQEALPALDGEVLEPAALDSPADARVSLDIRETR